MNNRINLLLTAVGCPGGPSIVKTMRQDSNIRIVGTDMRDDVLAKYMVDKFYQVRRRGRKHEGVGLGLAIAWQIVEASKGTIEVESEEGSGSCFTVRLPRARKIVAAMREIWKEGRDEGANSIDRR